MRQQQNNRQDNHANNVYRWIGEMLAAAVHPVGASLSAGGLHIGAPY